MTTNADGAFPWHLVEMVDAHLDAKVSQTYKDQPLAQDWARVCKIGEEGGESIAELILATGQNPRKGTDPDAKDRLLGELADAALSAMYAIQHFTKDIGRTREIVEGKLVFHNQRAQQVGSAQSNSPCTKQAHDWAVSDVGVPTCRSCGVECRAFRYIGQSLRGCDDCGQHICWHDGYERVEGLFGSVSLKLVPWKPGDRWYGWREHRISQVTGAGLEAQ